MELRSDIGEGYGLVIKVGDGDCFAVARDGRYVRFRVSGAAPRPGEIVRLPAATPAPSVFRRGMVRLALAASLVLAIGMGAVLVALQSHAAAYVAIDINPSLELALNYPGRVVGVDALNPDAVLVLDRVPGGRQALLGLIAREALAEVIRAAIEQGFLPAGEENVIQVTVVGRGRGIPGPEALRDEAAAVLDGHGAQAYLRVRSAESATRNEARKKGVSVNALLLAEEMAKEGMAPLAPGAEGDPGEAIRKVGAANVFKASELAGRRKGQENVPEAPEAPPGQGGSPRDDDPETEPGQSRKSAPAGDGKPADDTTRPDGPRVPGHGHADDSDSGKDGAKSPEPPQPSQPPSPPRPSQPPEQPEDGRPEQQDGAGKKERDSERDTPQDDSPRGDRDKTRKPGG